MKMRTIWMLGFGCALWLPLHAKTLEESVSVQPFIGWLLEEGEALEDVRFADVVEAVSGCRILPVDPVDPVDAEILDAIATAASAMLPAFAQSGHPVHEIGRVNEVSRSVEEFLLSAPNADPGFSCTIPLNASGEVQRSGYPDLRLEHLASGRIFYIDPKVYKAGSEGSSFRTFYFEPKKETNKILDDASHVILAVSHAGKEEGLWQFNDWKLVDLADFRVRLKAEFQASNRELYQERSILLRSGTE